MCPYNHLISNLTAPPQAIERAVEKYLVDYVQNLDKYATESATGQYPVTRLLVMQPKQERDAMEAQKAGTGKGLGLGPGPGGTATKTMPPAPGPIEQEEGLPPAGAVGPEEVNAPACPRAVNLYFKGL